MPRFIHLFTGLLFHLPLLVLAEDAVAEVPYDQNGDPRGIFLALTGVLIVFAGLAAISLFIALLPKILGGLERKSKEPESPNTTAVPHTGGGYIDEGTLAAIGMVIRAETERISGSNLKVTLGFTQSSWALSSKMRIIPGRINS
ncbi:MAG: OadG family protein [Verrucomicrobia bacterium]|nr:OadG family protein [Verrucomicrobiota bacterium]MCH8511596.1 OadG family protein [Kiritimatiellia bacterium]